METSSIWLKKKSYPLRSKSSNDVPLSLLFNIVLLAMAKRSKHKKISTDRKEISNFVFADDIIICIEILKKKKERKEEKTALDSWAYCYI